MGNGGRRALGGAAARSARTKAAKAPATREEQIARAEESVRKAQARVDAARQAYEQSGTGHGAFGITHAAGAYTDATTKLRAAQTRLENVRNPEAAATPKAPRSAGRLTLDQAHGQLARAVAGGDRTQVLAAAKALVAADAAEKRAATRASGTGKGRSLSEVLGTAPVPIRTIPNYEVRLDEHNPYVTRYAYGNQQLRGILGGQTIKDLREGASYVQARNPSTKPAGTSSKKALTDYIMQHIGPDDGVLPEGIGG